jgi:dolichol-phosphate mannosyltransferase
MPPPGDDPAHAHPAIDLSLIAPAHNEADNIDRLVQEVGRAFALVSVPGPAGPRAAACELLIVDDGSTDATRARIAALMPAHPWLRCVAMLGTPPGKGNGQSAAFHAGIRASRGALVATIDADLQNDPADLPAMVALLHQRGAGMVQGDRSHARRDNWVRRRTSAIGRFFRGLILRDPVRDTGCSLRVMQRAVALALPLEFKGAHRFIPFTAASLGYTVLEMPVTHRARTAGVTKYGLGITQRAIPGLIDCFAMRWMHKRRRPVACQPVAPITPGAKP